MTGALARALFASALVLSLASCGARSAETRDPNIVIAAWIAGPVGFNRLTSVSSASKMVSQLIFTPLVDLDAKMLPRWSSSLATGIDIDDGGRRYVVHLRPARWSDGAPLDARDVVFTLLLQANTDVIPGTASDFTLMSSARALDARTVEIRLSRPSPPFLLNALGETFPLPVHLLGKHPAGSRAEADFINRDSDFAQNPLVSGPFRIARNVPDAYMIFERNPSYWGPPARLPRIGFRVYPQQNSLYAAVDAGEVDVTSIPPQLWRVHDRLRGNHRFVTWPWNVCFMLLPNFADSQIAFIRDPIVRRAMLYAINRTFITQGIMDGQADVLDGPLPSFSPYFDKHLPSYGFDPAKARALLEADGWHLHGDVRMKNGVALRITLKTGGATDAVASDIAELIQENLHAVGIECALENEELQTFFQDIQQSKFELALRGRILQPYPDDFRDYDSSQTSKVGGSNYGSVAIPALDRAMRDARTATSPAASRAALDRYQEVGAAQLPVLYLYSNKLAAVVPRNLYGLGLSPLSAAALPQDVQFWYRQ
ncbi:MAG TPA: peptide ABC transporter substrate-binding protein [Candidatus Baltobacteraceae bacterium]